MKQCIRCGETFNDSDGFCTSCGAEQPEPSERRQTRCKKCGSLLSGDDVFCTACGTLNTEFYPVHEQINSSRDALGQKIRNRIMVDAILHIISAVVSVGLALYVLFVNIILGYSEDIGESVFAIIIYLLVGAAYAVRAITFLQVKNSNEEILKMWKVKQAINRDARAIVMGVTMLLLIIFIQDTQSAMMIYFFCVMSLCIPRAFDLIAVSFYVNGHRKELRS